MILVFDMSAITTFETLDNWIQKVRVEMGVTSPIFLCANKIDLQGAVSREAVRAWSDKNECTVFFTSALSGDGINELFQAAGEKVVNRSKSDFGPTPNLERAQQNKSCC
jgi:GTPase SAR1 family protein